MRLFICGSYADASDHAVFSVATIITNATGLINLTMKKEKKISFPPPMFYANE